MNQESKSRKPEQTAQAAVQQWRYDCTGACKFGQKELKKNHGNADSLTLRLYLEGNCTFCQHLCMGFWQYFEYPETHTAYP